MQKTWKRRNSAPSCENSAADELKSSDEILNDCLSIPDQGFTVTLNYLKRITNKLIKDEIQGPYKTTGRPRLVSGEDEEFLLDELEVNKTIYLRELNTLFTEFLGRPQTPSLSTIHKILERRRKSLKVVELRNIRRDEIECLEFLDLVQHIAPEKWYDIDGTANEKESFEKKRGRSNVGEPCILPQFHIGIFLYS